MCFVFKYVYLSIYLKFEANLQKIDTSKFQCVWTEHKIQLFYCVLSGT